MPRAVASVGNSRTRDVLGWHTTGGVSLNVLQDVLEANGHPVVTNFHDLRCSLSLKAIYDGASGTCAETVVGYGEWDTWGSAPTGADIVTVQPYDGDYGGAPGSTLSSDVTAIQAFVATQAPSCEVLLLCVHPYQGDLATNMGSNPPALSPAEDPDTVRTWRYFNELYNTLVPIYGSRLKLVPCAWVTYEIAQQADGAGFPGIASSADLFRDTSHGSKEGVAIDIMTTAYVVSGRRVGASAVSLGVSTTYFNAMMDVVDQICADDPRTRVTRC